MSEHKFQIKIETRPGGGYIARSLDASFPTFEGDTREEVEQKMQAYFLQLVDQKLDQLHLGGLKAAIHTKVNVEHRTLKLPVEGGSAASPTSAPQAISSSSSSSGPIIM